MKPTAVADGLLPGSGLIVDGRTAWGAPLLAPAILILSALAIALALGGAFAAWTLPRALPAYAALALAALLIRRRLAARERVDPEAAKRLARAAQRAWLLGEPDAAARARALTAAAPELPQAWRLLALVSGDAAAARRAEAIERRQR